MGAESREPTCKGRRMEIKRFGGRSVGGVEFIV